ncbi:hypothetical protein [Pelagerythrobacter aerophilus]|uniref:Uncharacterized protein n=1 Tax=Pelagerythrobacter aerophilus TaxID=2306995 RepID=A0A418NJW9_9SPHN|nr:hypothetical protein [Pelagerythrobacter aerophilus]RIV79595.1 hypothetical protein D2V04_06395 [Pelagerythrobacter aerophilus]
MLTPRQRLARNAAEVSKLAYALDLGRLSDPSRLVRAVDELSEVLEEWGMGKDVLAALRAADEDDVRKALEGAYVSAPLSEPAELLEFFNRMVDVLAGEREA